jgi:hypothetical protein
MKQSKPTPGPWEVSDTSIVSGDDDNGFCIAVIEDDGDYAAPHDQREANARLIAAAPDLLAALRGLVGLVQLIDAREPGLKTNHRHVDAINAIAKAESAPAGKVGKVGGE